MSKGFQELWMDQGVAGTALTNSTTQTSLMLGNTGEQATLPAKYFERIGKSLRLRAGGRISTVVTTPGTFKFLLRLGSIDVFDFGAMTLNTTAQTNTNWVLDVTFTCRAIGSGTSANGIGQGTFVSHSVIGSSAIGTAGAGTQMLPYNTAPGTAGNGFDSTTSQLIDLQGAWSVANASNSIRLEWIELPLWN